MFSPPQDPTAPGTKSPFGTWVQPSSWSHFPGHSLGTPCLYDPMEILPKCSFKLLSLSARNILSLSHSWLFPIRPMPLISRVTTSELSSQIVLPFQAQSPHSPLLSFASEEWWSPPISLCLGHLALITVLTYYVPASNSTMRSSREVLYLTHLCISSAWNTVDIQSLVLHQFNGWSPPPDL